jgi:hypothetical protein
MAPEYKIETFSKRKLASVWRVSHWWRVVHKNGQVLLTSETYSGREQMLDSANHFGCVTGLKVRG